MDTHKGNIKNGWYKASKHKRPTSSIGGMVPDPRSQSFFGTLLRWTAEWQFICGPSPTKAHTLLNMCLCRREKVCKYNWCSQKEKMRSLVSLLANPLIIEDKMINLWNQNTFKKTSDNILIPDATSYNRKCWLRQLTDVFLSSITLNWEHLKGENYLLEKAPSLGHGQYNIQSLSELMSQTATRASERMR